MPSVSLVDALSVFIPQVTALKSIPGIGKLTVPTFGFAMTTGPTINLPNMHMIEFPNPKWSLMHLLPNTPGTSFLMKLIPRKRKSSDGTSRGVILMGAFWKAGFSLQRLKKLRFKEPNLSLAEFADMIFSSFNLRSIKLPPSLASFAKASITKFSIDSATKWGNFSVNLGVLKLLKGVLPNLNLASSRLTLIDLSLNYGSKPYTWNFNSTCVGTFFGSSGKAHIRKVRNAFEFSFKSRSFALAKFLSQKKGGGYGVFSNLLKMFGVFKTTLSNLSIRIATKPTTLVSLGSVQFGSLLPKLHCEFLGLGMYTNTSSYLFGMEAGAVTLNAVVKTFLKFDISHIPFFGKLKIPDLTMLLMPYRFDFAKLKIIDAPLALLARHTNPEFKSLLLSIPIKFKIGTIVNMTAALANLKIDFHVSNITPGS